MLTSDPLAHLTCDAATKESVRQWLVGPYDSESKSALLDLLKTNPQEVIDAFYTTLTFGTGGLRGVMGIGSNRMNRYTVMAATQGLSDYLNMQPKKSALPNASPLSVIIGYDSRLQSKCFAEASAKVLAANGIQVYLFRDLRPTPLISFGCRQCQCSAAIMITASHNPPQYNGYKVFWDDGGQVLSPHDKGIMRQVQKISSPYQIKSVSQLQHPLIAYVEEAVETAYLQAIYTLQYHPQTNQSDGSKLGILYTNLHGTGITLVPKILHSWGFTNLAYVEEQKAPNGHFPTIEAPNPEDQSSLKLGIAQLQKSGRDLLIATDADADRIGVVVNHHGNAIILDGHQLACLCLAHILESRAKQGIKIGNGAVVKTIVTTELFRAIANAYDCPCYDVLTGFKYIAQKIRAWELAPQGHDFIFGGEDSYGYLLGTYTRDKDAISASALICEMALQAKLQGKTLYDQLQEIYRTYGIYRENLFSINFPDSQAGKKNMDSAMLHLRQSPPKSIANHAVIEVEDYLNSTKTNQLTGETTALSLPQSDVLFFWLDDGSKLVIRPSGTEPKIKIYSGVMTVDFANVADGIAACEARAQEFTSALKKMLK